MLKRVVNTKLKKIVTKTKPFSAGLLKINKSKVGFFKKGNKGFKPHQLLKITEAIKAKYLPFRKNVWDSLTSTSQKY
jgi:hypothetical protein